MKKLRELMEAGLLRVIFYKCITKSSTALVLLLLWDHYLNKGHLSVLQDGCFVVSLCLFGQAWLTYQKNKLQFLKRTEDEDPEDPNGGAWPRGRGNVVKAMDAVRNYNRRRHPMTDMVDFTDEHIPTDDDMDERERLLCRISSSLVSGLVFLLAFVIGILF